MDFSALGIVICAKNVTRYQSLGAPSIVEYTYKKRISSTVIYSRSGCVQATTRTFWRVECVRVNKEPGWINKF